MLKTEIEKGKILAFIDWQEAEERDLRYYEYQWEIGGKRSPYINFQTLTREIASVRLGALHQNEALWMTITNARYTLELIPGSRVQIWEPGRRSGIMTDINNIRTARVHPVISNRCEVSHGCIVSSGNTTGPRLLLPEVIYDGSGNILKILTEEKLRWLPVSRLQLVVKNIQDE